MNDCIMGLLISLSVFLFLAIVGLITYFACTWQEISSEMYECLEKKLSEIEKTPKVMARINKIKRQCKITEADYIFFTKTLEKQRKNQYLNKIISPKEKFVVETKTIVERAIDDLVKNGDLIEQTPRSYIVGYITQKLHD